MANPHLKLVSPNTVNGTVPPKRPTNAHLRTREYLTEPEVERLMKAAKNGRYAQRDATLILIAFRHGLRASEIAGLEWSQIEWGRNPTLHVRRAKKGTPAAHPIPGDELRALRELQRNTKGLFVFETERGGPFTAGAINRLIKRIGERAGFDFIVHAHMLRHACGYALANRGHDTRATSATKIFSIRCDIRNCRQRASKIFGEPRLEPHTGPGSSVPIGHVAKVRIV